MDRREFVSMSAALMGRLHLPSAFQAAPPGAAQQTATPEEILPISTVDPEIERQVEDLLARMTLEEKVRQLCSLRLGKANNTNDQEGSYTPQDLPRHLGTVGVGAVSLPIAKLDPKAGTTLTNFIQQVSAETRLGIPPLIDGEGLHGLRANSSCIFPSALAMAATWDTDLLHEVAVIVGKEARSRGLRRIFAPVLNLCRDSRNGRTEETYGEDPYLASRMGVAFVKGLQSQDVIATPKHFVANFEGDAGRDSADAEFSERALRELYFVPFKAAVMEAGALGMMCAYNSLNGIPCVLNSWLLTDVLRKEWGFQGAVVSDWTAVSRSLTDLHAVATRGEAARRAVAAGTDTEAPKLDVYDATLTQEVTAGRCRLEDVDEAVRRLLRLKFRLGLFERRYCDPDQAAALADAAAHRATALRVAQKAVVLLKNENSILPLRPSIKSIAVIGPNADEPQLGGYSPEVVRASSPLEALRSHLGRSVRIDYAKGCDLTGNRSTGFAEAIAATQSADVVILFLGGSTETAGEERDRADLDLTGQQEDLIDAVTQAGKPTIVVLISGGPVTMSRWLHKVDALLMAWYAGEEGGPAIAEVLTGATNPSGRLPVTFPQFTGQMPMPYNHRPYGRIGTLLEVPGVVDNERYNPVFPFGYGLSYTSFRYSELKVTTVKSLPDPVVEVSVTLINSGRRSGDEVVQLYLSMESCRITQPVQRLCAFRRVTLEPGASQVINFHLGAEQLAFLNEKFRPEVNLGKYFILIGSNCREGLRASFEIV